MAQIFKTAAELGDCCKNRLGGDDSVIRRFFVYLQRRRQHSYTQLWEMVYGDGDQGTGLLREVRFAWEVAGMWKAESQDKE